MPARVTLKVTRGTLAGEEFAFEDYTTCIIGRGQDCHPKLPDDEHHRTISRNHCLLDINPPDIRVRDFGSLNGTWVNGQKIGQREKDQSPEEAAKMIFPEHDLKDGDEIKLADTVFHVGIYTPAVCVECSKEIPEDNRAQSERAPGVYQCEDCHIRARTVKRKEPPKKKPRVCAKCGKDVSGEIGAKRVGKYVCRTCKKDPFEMLKLLLDLAKSGDKELLAIQGYTVIKELGRGGMGAVYLARHDKTAEEVALKVMLPEVAANERATRDFLRETKNTKALRHSNIAQLRDSGCSNGIFFFTLEFCDGGSAEDLMKRHSGVLSVDEGCKIILQALDGLEYAHKAEIPHVKLKDGTIGKGYGLVHRDIKPANIFLSGSGGFRIAKVADFGLSKAFETAGLSGQTRTGTVGGTPIFMPRQQVINFKYAKPGVDVWAMAASLYNMLTGAYPREFSRGKDVWQTVLQTDPVPIRKRKSSIPRKLAKVIDEALVDKPSIRIKSAAGFKRRLEKVL
jgi:eukaryotic-like serine/threonine-protein kinase